ncbi:geranylgeranyl reductase family protein [Actinobaculum sp. 313]|uniref:geranylgeranyl reductase family protein n=1 Tax=Actinobaculum sp. 313 TaxID=2495645 RepID=UPI000D5260A7|nr:geranylgeranyl reductase family protein [Actinobaculum sp. 313]AWE42935.1 FAD-dependent oxidoreductase [Actinobaculum sp. 313]
MEERCDVLIVGAGPAGSATAHYLATAGLDVVVLEKATFPRDKVCGDGLTPRTVGELVRMGVDTRGWARNHGLRTYGGGHCIEVPWPEVASLPSYGLARSRRDLDHALIRHAVHSGALLHENMTVTAPLVHERTGRITGVVARHGASRELHHFRARWVVDAGGVSARLATAMGRHKDVKRPMGVAHRAYFRSPRSVDTMMESHLELWEGRPHESALMPGYGWIFALGDGVVNVGLGSLSSNAKPTGLDYRKMFEVWMRNVPEEWELAADNRMAPLRGAALPMAFNRKPHYRDGLLLVGDAGGMVSPFNGEGIAYALQSGRLAADAIVQAHSRPTVIAQERALEQYPAQLSAELGGYYSLGRVFAALIERPQIMHLCVTYGLPRPTLMRLVMKLLSDCYDRQGGDWMDRLIATFAKAVPKA